MNFIVLIYLLDEEVFIFLLVLFTFLPNLSGLVYARSTGTSTTLVNDADGDVVEDSNDVCSGTVADNSPTTPFANPGVHKDGTSMVKF